MIPQVPKVISIQQLADRKSIQVDGEEFPWAVVRDSISVNPDEGGIASITMTLYADFVEIVDKR